MYDLWRGRKPQLPGHLIYFFSMLSFYTKHALLSTGLALLLALPAAGQGRSISREKKMLEPVVTATGDTLRVGDMIGLPGGTGTNGQFLYVQLLNGFNEPVKPADSRVTGQRQPILFFKQQDGVTYLFTKFFVVNVEPALAKGEIRREKR